MLPGGFYDFNANTDIYLGGQKIMYYDFIDYTDASQLDNIYVIFALGDEAIMLKDLPFTKNGVNGIIYNIDESGIYIKDAVSYKLESESWEEVSQADRTFNVSLDPAGVVIDNNEIVDTSVLKVGDKIRVLGTEDGYEAKKAGGSYTGYIIFVEK